METYEKVILNDMNNVISMLKKNKSMSMYPFLCFDLDQLYDIAYETGVENLPNYDFDNNKIELFYKKHVDNNEIKIFYNNIDFIKTLVNSIYDFFSNYSLYKLYQDTPKQFVSMDKSLDICTDFLDSYNQDYLDILYNVCKDSKLLCPKDYDKVSNLFGVSYSGYLAFTPYILVASINSIITSITVAHELSHVYSSKLTNNYPLLKQLKKFMSPTLEIRPFTTELFFQDYLIKSKICLDDIKQIQGEFNGSIFEQAQYILESIDNNKDNEIKMLEDNNYKQAVLYIIGRSVAIYLYSLNDKEKSDYLLNKIDTECCEKELLDIFKDNNMDIEDIMNFDSAKKLIINKWK